MNYFSRQPMPAPLPPTKSPPIGSRRPLTVIQPTPTTFEYDTRNSSIVGLIDQRNLDWGPWAITFDPMGQEPAVYSAPAVVGTDGGGGGVGVQTGAPRVLMSWGVAGILRSVQFDYPAVGGCIIVNANVISLGVRATDPTAAGNVLAIPENRAQVGAWLAPAAHPSAPSQAILVAGNLAQGPVPPFARYINVAPFTAGALIPIPAQEIKVTFLDANLTARWHVSGRFGIGTSGPQFLRADVPPWAVAVDISGTTDAGVNVPGSNTVMWELSFA